VKVLRVAAVEPRENYLKGKINLLQGDKQLYDDADHIPVLQFDPPWEQTISSSCKC
jgi:hypothetical protein